MTFSEAMEVVKVHDYNAGVLQRISEAIFPLTHEERTRALLEINHWQWPTGLDSIKPEGTERWTHEEMFRDKFLKAVRHQLREVVSEFDQSRMHWIENLHRTEQEHFDWWWKSRQRTYVFGEEVSYPAEVQEALDAQYKREQAQRAQDER